MHRVRVGLTGLSVVFLLVMFAAAFFGLTRREDARDVPPNAISADANASDEAPSEPLAELGVTPGYTPEEGASNATADQPGR